MKAIQVRAILILKNSALAGAGCGINTALMTPEEIQAWNTLQDSVATVSQETNFQINTSEINYWCGNDALDVNRWGIGQFPAVRIYAEYPDGTQAYKDFQPLYPGANVDLEQLPTYLSAFVTKSFGSGANWLCKILPPLCSLGKYAWLAIGVATTYKATTTKKGAQLAWGAASVLVWQQYVQRSGIAGLSAGEDCGCSRQICDKEGNTITHFLT